MLRHLTCSQPISTQQDSRNALSKCRNVCDRECHLPYLCFAGRCYRQAVWLPAAVIEAKRPSLLRNFLSRHAGGDIDTDWADTNNINPAWYKVSTAVLWLPFVYWFHPQTLHVQSTLQLACSMGLPPCGCQAVAAVMH